MPESLVIPARFNGPPDSGHGGYTCGAVAEYVGAPVAEVELRAPPPLETSMDVHRLDGRVEVRRGDTLVATGAASDFELTDIPAPVDVPTAAAAARASIWAEKHPFPTCFACGPRRDPGDGLREFTCPVPGREEMANDWTPPEEFADRDGNVRPVFIWSALDCPTSAPVADVTGAKPIVLARLAMRPLAPVRAGRPHAVVAWKLGEDGRKKQSAAALFDEDGGLCAYSKALWIELRTG